MSRCLAVSCLAIALSLVTPTLAVAQAITPAPAQMTKGEGAFALTARTRIYVPIGDAELLPVAVYFRDMVKRSRGLSLQVVAGQPGPGEKAIQFQRIQTFAAEDPEAYHLNVSPEGVTVGATTRAGLFYGAVSLWQLATETAGTGRVALPAVGIFDAPRFKWRGLMIDSARHFQSVAEIKKIIDGMASQKLNILQWHLTDDQAWRLEIKAYPNLTKATAFRQEAGAAGYGKGGKPLMYGGFYTQAQARAIVAYAAARNITVVPEIDVPGHATAAITAYPEFGTEGARPKQGLSDWGVYPNLYNVEDRTFAFLDTVFDEVMDIFPSPYIHVGGDEAIKPQWQASPAIQAKMKALGLKDEMALQSWFIARIGEDIAAKGRRLIGWDEILEGGIADNATVMSWRGIDGAVAAAKLGHDTVLSPAPELYLNHGQSTSGDEPPGRGKVVTLQDLYAFNPAPDAIAPEARKHILGLQANIWTEHARTDERVERQVFPKLTALAEIGWSAPERRSWAGFADRLPANLDRLSTLGIRYDRTPFEPQIKWGEGNEIRLATAMPLGEIRYEIGRKVTAASKVFPGGFKTTIGQTLSARTYLNGRPLGNAKTFVFTPVALETRTSHQLETCQGKLVLNLEDDDAAKGADRAIILIDILNPCWMWRAADTSHGFDITARVASYPFNFQLGNHPEPVKVDAPVTRDGEFNVHLDTCDGPVIAALPLKSAVGKPGVSELKGTLPATPGKHDLCLTFAQSPAPPQWALKDIRLKAR